jgi:hypothetical protein
MDMVKIEQFRISNDSIVFMINDKMITYRFELPDEEKKEIANYLAYLMSVAQTSPKALKTIIKIEEVIASAKERVESRKRKEKKRIKAEEC